MRAGGVAYLLGVLVACGSSGSPGATPAQTSSSGNSLVGQDGFAVHYAVVDTQEAHEECGWEEVLPDGTYAAMAVILSDQVLPGYCSGAGSASAIAGHPFVHIQVADPTYATDTPLPDGGAPEPVVPATYAIADEGNSDDDLCSVPGTGGSALVDVGDWGDGGGATGVATSVSGSVTLTTVAAGHVVGRFDVMLAAVLPSGDIDTPHPTPFSGTFDATVCPGTSQ